jgi:hypothetical protein
MTTYRVLIPGAYLGMGMVWPAGVTLGPSLDADGTGAHWHDLDDPAAPPELEGRDVELRMARDDDGQPAITGRRVIVAHACPPDDGDGMTPCCGLPLYELPPRDRVAKPGDEVTCGGAP